MRLTQSLASGARLDRIGGASGPVFLLSIAVSGIANLFMGWLVTLCGRHLNPRDLTPFGRGVSLQASGRTDFISERDENELVARIRSLPLEPFQFGAFEGNGESSRSEGITTTACRS
jgi:hypothetical protein